ncbi:hypothetical protein J6590_104641 [Homalodisca vitripennis]|nr:hypothetical protein J6590_104641 [Homalodisca vitripennis]
MERNKVNCDDSGLLRALLEEVGSGGELETTMETSVADQSVRYDGTPAQSSILVENPTLDVDVDDDIDMSPRPTAGPSGVCNILPRKRYRRPNLARPIGYDLDVSDTTVDDTDEDKDYCPSDTEPSTDHSKPKLGMKQRGRRERGRGFSASTPEKKKPIRLKVSRPKLVKPKTSVGNNPNSTPDYPRAGYPLCALSAIRER